MLWFTIGNQATVMGNRQIFHNELTTNYTAMTQNYLDLATTSRYVGNAENDQCQQEAQLILTNLCYLFRGQSRSPNLVPSNVLGVVSYQFVIVTLSLRHSVLEIHM